MPQYKILTQEFIFPFGIASEILNTFLKRIEFLAVEREREREREREEWMKKTHSFACSLTHHS
jgi:hypothetical protein